jgi:hypothetical protein
MTTTTKCDNCNKQVPSQRLQGEGYPDNGLEIFPLTFGYYGGFIDNLPLDEDKPSGERVVFCHDCSVSLFRQFPSMLKGLGISLGEVASNPLGFGFHPCEGDTPCCEFSWDSAGEQDKIKIVNKQTMQWETVAISDIM